MANKSKRKNEFVDTKQEPALKALKKQDIILHFNALQEKYESLIQKNKVLEEENKNHIESILLLEETVKLLDKKVVKKVTTGSQTEIIRCEECEFPAECMNDLVYHMFEFHTLEDKDKDQSYKCNFCSHKFISKNELMMHKKTDHSEKVQLCIHFSDGVCTYGNRCWFSHEVKSLSECDYNCNCCEKTFMTNSELMRHKKSKHKEKVQDCKNHIKNKCQYSSHTCWFIHKNYQNELNKSPNEDTLSNNEQMQKLIKMVEDYTKRIDILESMMVKE